MYSAIGFLICCFFISFFLCIPIGPVNLEVFQYAIKKQYHHALITAFGAAVGDAIWALCAFFGLSPFLTQNHNNLHLNAVFLLVTAIIILVLGLIALKDARLYDKIERREEAIAAKITRKRWSLLKGLIMVMVNPLGIGSWVISLSFLRSLKFYIPLTLTWEILYFGSVALGAFTYFTVLVFITYKSKHFFNPQRTARIIKWLGIILILFAVFFLYKALIAFLH